MKQEIKKYLQGPRDYREGVYLYQKYGINLRLKKQFAVNETAATKAIMIEELRKLAGMTEAEFKNLPRLALMSDSALKTDTEKQHVAPVENPEKVTEHIPATETQKKIIRFRENFPFLNQSDCPDSLKILVADMFTSFGNYKNALEKLHTLGDQESEEAAKLCETTVEEYLKNREIWDELEHYKEHGQILGKAAKFKELEKADELSKLTDVELVNKRRSAEVNISKRKKALEAARDAQDEGKIEKESAALSTWQEKKEAIDRELEARKKK